jgi:hypothetical protein
MLVWANEIVQQQKSKGGSVWVGDESDTAKYCLRSVQVFQQALIILAAGNVMTDFEIKISNPVCHCCHLFLKLNFGGSIKWDAATRAR